MIRYECDRCKRTIDPNTELRYIVKMEVFSSLEAPDDCLDDDRDYLLEIHEVLERSRHLNNHSGDHSGSLSGNLSSAADGVDLDRMEDGQRQSSNHFDLCRQCYEKFMNSPVGREKTEPIGASQN